MAREDRDQRVASSVRSRPRETARDDAWHSNSGWWSNHSWREGSRAPRHADRASRIGDVPWHRERSQPNDIVFQDSWHAEEGFPPLFPNTADITGPPQLYRKPRGQINWKLNPRYGEPESPNSAIKRLQTELGCYFVGGWHAYVRHHARGGAVNHDPLRHDPAFAAQLLSTVMDAQGDIRIAMRNLGINVDWWDVERKGNKGKAQGKGNKSDAKGSGKRPASTDDHARAQRRRRD